MYDCSVPSIWHDFKSLSTLFSPPIWNAACREIWPYPVHRWETILILKVDWMFFIICVDQVWPTSDSEAIIIDSIFHNWKLTPGEKENWGPTYSHQSTGRIAESAFEVFQRRKKIKSTSISMINIIWRKRNSLIARTSLRVLWNKCSCLVFARRVLC